MPNNIELAISAALLTDDSQNTPSIAHVLSAYVQVAGFTDLQPSFAICKSSSSLPSSGCSKCSDAVVISAFERALEKAASSNSPAASEASKLVPKVRRQYWRGILIAAGSKDDELTQMVLEAERKETGNDLAFLSLESSSLAASDIAISNDLVPSKKSKKKKRRNSKDLSSAPHSPTSSSADFTPVAVAPSEPQMLGSAGYNPTLTRAALVSPRLKALSMSRTSAHAAASPPPLKTSQRYVAGEGYKTYYPCPCCGGGSVRAKQMMSVLGIDEDGEGSDGVVLHEGEEEHGAPMKKKVSRKRKTSTKGEEGERKKTRQVKRRSRVGIEKPRLPVFDPFAPSSSRVCI